jgi:hypothetical protein
VAKDNRTSKGDKWKSVRRDASSGKFLEIKGKSVASSALTQRERVTNALRTANTATQTFKSKNAR